MGVTDTIARVITVFKADTSDMKSGLRELQGEEKKLGEAQLKRIEETNKGLDKYSDRIRSLGPLIQTAFEGMRSGMERVRLEAATGFVGVEALRKASGGLVREMDLLRFSAQARAGVLKADNDLLVAAQKAMRGLTQQGFEYADASKRITDAIVKGEAEPLKDLGIVIRKTTTDSERYQAIKEKIVELAGKAKDANLSEAESMQAATVKYQDSIEKLKESLGRLAVALEPIVTAVAKIADKISSLLDKAADRLPTDTLSQGVGAGTLNRVSEMTYDQAAFARLQQKIASGGNTWLATREYLEETGQREGDVPGLSFVGSRESIGGFTRQAAAPDTSEQEIVERKRKADEERKKLFGKTQEEDDAARAAAYRKWAESPEGRRAIFRGAIGGIGYARESADGQRASGDWSPSGLGDIGSIVRGRDEFGFAIDEEKQFSQLIKADDTRQRGAFKSKLEGIFGPIGEFQAYQRAFGALTGAVQGAFSAWIDGSKSAGEAFRELFASSLKGMASDLAGKAIMHGVYALGALAIGGPFAGATAAAHGKAAAAAAAGAAAIGIMAKALHGGSDAPTGAGASVGAGGPVGGGGGGDAGGAPPREGSHTVLIVGDPHAQDSPRRRGANFRRQLERVGLGNNGVSRR